MFWEKLIVEAVLICLIFTLEVIEQERQWERNKRSTIETPTKWLPFDLDWALSKVISFCIRQARLNLFSAL